MDASEYIRDRLHYDIVTGRLSVEERLDEYSMVKRFQVPRSAVRTALLSMTEAGLLNRARRAGTTPRNPVAWYNAEGTPAYWVSSDELRMVTQHIERMDAPVEIAADLELEEGARVTLIERSTRLGGSPILHWRIWTPIDIENAVPDGIAETRTWYETLKTVTGHSLFHVLRSTVETTATASDAKLLDIEVGDPISFLCRVTRLADGQIVDLSFSRRKRLTGITTDRLIVEV
jgi:GntR family transcriptional regulator